MKSHFAVFALLVSISVYSQDLVILHTNDLHSHLNGMSPEAEYTPLVSDNDPTHGGFARIAGFISAEKEKYGDKLLVVDAGDFLMGTLFQMEEVKQGFELNLMKKMGYDFVALGNHEFDYGTDTLASIISDCKAQGPIPTILNANYHKNEKATDKKLVQLFADGTILPYSVIEKNGLKIGLFSILGNDAEGAIASYLGISFDDPKMVAAKTAAYLKNTEKVDLVVALSHSGVFKNKKGEWFEEDVELAHEVPNIDVVIGGHSHTRLDVPLRAGNAIIVQTGWGGAYAGKVEISFDKAHRPQMNASLFEMDDHITADAGIQQMIDEEQKPIAGEIFQKLGIDMSKPVAETSFDLSIDDAHPQGSNLGPFVADGVYSYLNSLPSQKIDLAIVASGTVRTNLKKGNKGVQDVNDVFNIVPLGSGNDDIPGSPVGKIYITGSELKKVLELILAVSPSKPDYYLFFSGMKLYYNPQKRVFKKILAIEIGNEKEGFRNVSFSKKDKTLYSIAANKYILSFIGSLKQMSHGIVNVVAKNADGSVIQENNFLIDADPSKDGIQEVREWIVLYHFLNSFADTNGNGIPDVPVAYQNRGNPMFVGK